MRGNLKIWFLAVIIAITVAPILAQDFQWSGGISITEWTDLTGLSSRCNAKHFGRPVGGTSTKMNVLTVVTAHSSMSYEVSLSTVGIEGGKIEEAIMTPDGGNTVWQTNFFVNKGYSLSLPIGNEPVLMKCKVLMPKKKAKDKDVYESRDIAVALTPGEMSSLEWKVAVCDKHNKITIVIIPITYDSTRKVTVGFDIMVQQAMPDFDQIPNTIDGDHTTFTYLRGFVPSWATPDPAVVALNNTVAGMTNNHTQPPPSPSQQAPPPTPVPIPIPLPPVVVPQKIEPPMPQGEPLGPPAVPQAIVPTVPQVESNIPPTIHVDGQVRVSSSSSVSVTATASSTATASVSTVIKTQPSEELVTLNLSVTVVIWKGIKNIKCPTQLVNSKWFYQLMAKPQCISLCDHKTGAVLAYATATANSVQCTNADVNILEIHIYRGEIPTIKTDFITIEED